MNVKLPLEVSAKDRFLSRSRSRNEKDKPVKVSLKASFGDLLDLETDSRPSTRLRDLAGQTALETTLGAGERKTIFYPVTVKGTLGKQDQRLRRRGRLKEIRA